MMGSSSECHIENCFFPLFLVWAGVIFFFTLISLMLHAIKEFVCKEYDDVEMCY